VIWEGVRALQAVERIVVESHVTGDLVRATLLIADLDRVLEILRQQHARLISVTPIQGTLEEYFLTKTSEAEPASA